MPRRASSVFENQPTEREVEDAVDVITRDYYSDVRSVGDDLIQRFDDGDFPDPGSFHDALHEAIESTQRVIYTFKARLGLIATENYDAYFDDFGPLKCSENVPYEQMMMLAAMERDVVEYMQRAGFDPTDDSTFESEDDEE